MVSPKNIIALTAALSILSLAACSNEKEQTSGQAEPVMVRLARPGDVSTGGSVSVSGQIESVQTANISTKVMGYIEKIHVNVGDRVRAGQLLVSINSTDILAKRAQAEAMLAQAEAALTSAQKDLDRFTALYARQSASAKELDNVTLQHSSAKAQVEAARQMRNEANALLSYTRITAPFEGVVTQKMIDAGSTASPGMPILTVERTGILQASAAVPESQIVSIKKGDPATVVVKSTGKHLDGRVIEISESSQYTGGQYYIKVSLPEYQREGLLAGMYVNVTIPVTGPVVSNDSPVHAVLVPVAAIHNRDQLTGLYTVSQSKTALLRWVRLGKTYGDRVEVLSGLSRNESFVVEAQGRLFNGAPVTVDRSTAGI